MNDINTNPITNLQAAGEGLTSYKGLFIAAGLVLVALVFGIIALFNYQSSTKYQGMIQQIETGTSEIESAQTKLAE